LILLEQQRSLILKCLEISVGFFAKTNFQARKKHNTLKLLPVLKTVSCILVCESQYVKAGMINKQQPNMLKFPGCFFSVVIAVKYGATQGKIQIVIFLDINPATI